MVLNATAAVATSDGPPSGSGGAFTSRPSASAAAASVRTGAVSRRTAHSVSPAAVTVISRNAARNVGECQARGGSIGTVRLSQSPSGRCMAMRTCRSGSVAMRSSRQCGTPISGTMLRLARIIRWPNGTPLASSASGGSGVSSAVRPGRRRSCDSTSWRRSGGVVITMR